MVMTKWRPQFPSSTPMAKLIASRDTEPYCFGNHQTPAIVCPKCKWEDDCKVAAIEKAIVRAIVEEIVKAIVR